VFPAAAEGVSHLSFDLQFLVDLTGDTADERSNDLSLLPAVPALAEDELGRPAGG